MSTVLGKRKEREINEPLPTQHGSTLFVSNLPYTATSTDLQTLFSDIAPVRSAFVALEKGSGVSKGVGYVAFAVKDDAQLAIEKASSAEGIVLDGRSLRVQWAASKPKDDNISLAKPETRAPPRPSFTQTPRDPLAIRTIIVSGLPTSIESKVLWKKFRKLGGAQSVVWPAKSESGTENVDTAHVVFDTPSSAAAAVTKLHAHVYKGCLLSVTLKRRLDTLVKPAKTPEASPMLSRASRLIVRNLPWSITEQDLRALFLPYGPIYSIHIPSSSSSGEDGASKVKKGFAFVWMLSKQDAEKAIEGCNGRTVKAGLAEDLVGDKQKRKKQKRMEKRRVEMQGANADADGDGEEPAVGGEKERVIAVDWALSKAKWTEELAKAREVSEDGTENRDDATGSESDENEGEDEGGDEDEVLGVHEGHVDEDESEEETEGDRATEDTRTKPQLPPPETGTTLFIRNVPFAATDDEMRTLFRSFGPLRYARITMDPATGRSRGTGFACFWNKSDADKVIEQSELLRVETAGGHMAIEKNPFTLPSILTPDPSSSLAHNLVLHGRTLDVVCAVTRDQAGKLKDEGEKRREKADKRNMYLLREGVILPNSPAASTLTAIELEKRTNSFNARRALLRSNPALFVSKTRLSVRQIPLFVTERVLKRLAIHATRAFEAEVKDGRRAALTEDELYEPADQKESEAKESKGKYFGRSTGVKQAKIVRQQERIDVVTGKGRSKGYGFVEMQTHADALRVLRWANNNQNLGGLFESWWKDELKDLLKVERDKEERDEMRLKKIDEERRGTKKAKDTLIVEFSIENAQVVHKRATHQKERELAPTSAKASKIAAAAPPTKKATKTSQITAPKADLEGSPTKKRRTSHGSPKSEPFQVSTKGSTRIGSLIGSKRRKRKQTSK